MKGTPGRSDRPSPISVGDREPEHQLVRRVVASTGLPEAEAARVIEDVVAYFAEPVEVYVRRRHHELQSRGVKNAVAFPVIRADLAARVVAPPQLSDRQLRRIVYG